MAFIRLTTVQEVQDLVKSHNSSKYVVLDTETTSIDPRKAELLSIQLSGIGDDVYFFDAAFAPSLLGLREDLTIVAHHYNYDAHVLFHHKVDLTHHTWRDTITLGYLLDENRDSYSLDSYVKEYWGDGYKEKFWEKWESYQEADNQSQLDYACADIVYTKKLYESFMGRIPTADYPLVEHIHKLQHNLLRTEILGIAVDVPYLSELGVKIKSELDTLEPQMRELAKDEIRQVELEMWIAKMEERKTTKGKQNVIPPVFSFKSAAQLKSLLYTQLRLPVQRNEKTKQISTDYDSLENIKEYHPLVGLLQHNRELQKVYDSYVTGTIDRLDQERIYPQFSVSRARTGRVAHSNPNVAQLPKSGGVRGIYVPDRGRKFISADYDQLEVIIEANLTRDKNLIRMLENGESKHNLTARELRCDRSTAKTLNFALQYWCSHFKVAKLLDCSVDEGLRVYHRYWEIYSGSRDLKARTDALVDAGEPLVNCYGRQRRFPKVPRQKWDSAYRQAYNFMIQSTGSDFTSESFYTISEYLEETGYGRGLFTVHDENLIEVKDEHVEEVEAELVETMERIPLKYFSLVPFKATSSGPMCRWQD